jgi:flagellar biosynthesis GTPase FlhF
MSCDLLFRIWDYLYFNKIVRGGAINETHPDFYVLHFGHFDSVQIGNLIYKDATIKLDRKYQNYLAGKDFVQGCVPQTNSNCGAFGCSKAAVCLGLCKSHYDAFYRKAHPEQVAAHSEKWRKNNKDKVNSSRRRRYADDPEQHKEHVRNYRKNNPDKIREYKRKYREKHKEEINAQKRAKRQENPEKIKEQERAAYYRTQENRKERSRQYYQEHKEERAEKAKQYREDHREELKAIS